jgi:hypothetical protein
MYVVRFVVHLCIDIRCNIADMYFLILVHICCSFCLTRSLEIVHCCFEEYRKTAMLPMNVYAKAIRLIFMCIIQNNVHMHAHACTYKNIRIYKYTHHGRVYTCLLRFLKRAVPCRGCCLITYVSTLRGA